MGTVTIERETLCQVAMDADALLAEHYEELCLHKDRKVLAPRWDQYMLQEHAGALLVVAAREQGALVGYACFFVGPHMHYGQYMVAVNDVLFLSAAHRQGSTGIRLIRECIRQARDFGAHHIAWRAKLGTPLIKILKRLGHHEEEIVLGMPL